jgi:hypothetical protein
MLQIREATVIVARLYLSSIALEAVPMSVPVADTLTYLSQPRA